MSDYGQSAEGRVTAHRTGETHTLLQPYRRAKLNWPGDNTANRAIPHGLGIIPVGVLFTDSTNGHAYIVKNGEIHYLDESAKNIVAVTAMDATNIYVGNAVSYVVSQNSNLYTYNAIVFG